MPEVAARVLFSLITFKQAKATYIIVFCAMRQIGLIPAGCQLGFNGGVAATPDYVCYASSVAIYFLHPKTFAVLKIMAYNSRSICSFAIDPSGAGRVAVGSMDGSLCVWDISREEMNCTVTFGVNTRCFVDWEHFLPDMCIVAMNNPHLSLYSWKTTAAGLTPESLKPLRTLPDSRLATVLKCSLHIEGLFAVGCDDGSVLIESCVDNRKKNILRATSGVECGEVADIQWDIKSNLYILVAYSSIVSLLDIEIGAVVHSFDKQGTGICSAAWMHWAVGNFVTSNPRTGVIKVWNASQKQALESVRIPCNGGILALAFMPSSTTAVCCCSDGSIVAYDFVRRDIVSSTFAGHTDTVFDCCFSPSDPNIIATCSFDGTIKIWNVTELTLLKTFFNASSIFYSCGWSPCGKLLACTTIKGEVFLWNIETGRAVAKYSHHSKASYSVRWRPHPSQSNQLCSTSADGSVVVFEIPLERLADARSGAGIVLGSNRKKNSTIEEDSNILCRIGHSSAAYGCAWSPTDTDVLCVGFADSWIRVYNFKSFSINPAPIFDLKGHSERVFSCSWSPIIRGLLASGSDDKTIAIWKLNLDIESKRDTSAAKNGSVLNNVIKTLGFSDRGSASSVAPARILKGHRSNVRALGWNHEHADVLQSGSWDSMIKIWNAKQGICLQSVYGHVLDVYTVVAHPKRPFTYVSTSRDTTIRVWEMEGIFAKMRIRTILNFSLDSFIASASEQDTIGIGDFDGTIEHVDGHDDNATTALSCVLNGQHSKSLAALIRTTRTNILAREGEVDTSGPLFWDVCLRSEQSRLELIEAMKDILSFFCGSNGSVQLWGAVRRTFDQADNSYGIGTSVYGKPSAATVSVNSPVVLEGRILGIARSEARQAESLVPLSKRNGESELDPKYKELLKKAAIAYLKSGDFIKYCELLIEIGDWLEAIAFAPSISQELWEGLTRIYAGKISHEKTTSFGIPYYIAIGQDFEAIKGFLHDLDYQNAMTLTMMSEERVDLISASAQTAGNSTGGDSRKSEIQQLFLDARKLKPSCRQKTESEDEIYRQCMRQIVGKSIQESWSKSLVFEAAAKCFIVGDAPAASDILILGGEFEIAQVLRLCFGMVLDKDLIRSVASRAMFLGDLKLGLDIISFYFRDVKSETSRSVQDERSPRDRKFVEKIGPMTQVEIEQGLLISRHRAARNPVDKGELLLKYNLSPLHIWLQLGVEMEAIGDDADALGCYSICGDTTQVSKSLLDRSDVYFSSICF